MNDDKKKLLVGIFDWFDERLPISSFWRTQLTRYPAPKNFNLWYFFGSLALLVLVLQLATGLFLAIHYQPNPHLAYWSVLRGIERDSHWGWLIRSMHIVGASAFFMLVYLHMYRAIMYGSYKKPRELLWLVGIFIYLVLAAEAFLGYLLPWGQMSYWGSAVVTNFATAIPGIGKPIAEWLRGSFVIGAPTLNRFFVFHVFLMPLLLLALVLVHMIALHQVGSNNPDGIEIHENVNETDWPRDGIPFHPYYTVKDLFGVSVFFVIFFWFVFYKPSGWGLLLDKLNYTPANILHTPSDIHPLWFFLPFYAMLRGIPNKMYGIMAFAGSFALLACLPLLDRNPIRSIRYRSVLYKINILMLPASFIWLGLIAHGSATQHDMVYGLHITEVFYATFLLLPFFNRERTLLTKVVWFVAAELVVWLIDVWMYSIHAHGWHLMLQTDWIPAAYMLLIFGLSVVFPSLARDARTVPERVTAGGIFH
ncbi:cytochrome b N-terminal domain-containing protein [Oleiagrimonas sp.]|uniref:cytochrome b n=1 Tax=Oleiagrimonas sp. TaxID=2010330 RepID=UPI002609BBE0|nr:cytochrome b N-terminal domain-containing protein [Oleiagrimonas sp.]MDA3914876.1 cytochrome b N-terminal domain-containing protein [Oleiagrimonas sp.]